MLRAAIPVTLVICGSIILQYHAIPYWVESFGMYVGTGTSIFLEVAGLWAWTLKGKSAILIGLCAGTLTLMPPIYQRYDMLIHTGQQQTKIYNDSVQLIKEELKERQGKLNLFLRNSEKRSGWLDSINKESRALNQLREKLNDKLSNPVKQPSAIETSFTLSLQIMMLMFAFLSNIFALRKLREHFCTPQMRRNVQIQSEDVFDDTIKKLQDMVAVYMEKHELSIIKAAKKFGVDRHNLSYLIKCIKHGDRKPKKEVVEQLQNFFGITN